MPVITADKLKRLAVHIFEAAGVDRGVAERVASHLVDANLAGVDSHGVMRLPTYIEWVKEDKVACDDRVEVLQNKGASAMLDGHRTFGPVAASRAVEISIANARQFGVGLVTVRNASHIGRLGEYAEFMARQGLIGFICGNMQGAGQLVAPWGGRDRRLSTNPMAWGVPTGADPMVLDIATSASSEGKVRVKMRRGQQIPPGWAMDSTGKMVTNPAELYGPPLGALMAAGGHKGYGLALMVEALAGALTGAGCVRPEDEIHVELQAFVVIAIDVATFTPLGDFTGMIDGLVSYVKASRQLDADVEILVPNDPEIREREQRLANGIYIEEDTWGRIEATAHSVGVEMRL